MAEIIFKIVYYSLYYLLCYLLIKLSCAPNLKLDKKSIGLISIFTGIRFIIFLEKIDLPILTYNLTLIDDSVMKYNFKTEKMLTDVLFFSAVIFFLCKSERLKRFKYLIPINVFELLLLRPANTVNDFICNLELPSYDILNYVKDVLWILDGSIMVIILLVWIRKGIYQIKFSIMDFAALILVDFITFTLYGVPGVVSLGHFIIFEKIMRFSLVIMFISEIIIIYYIFVQKYMKYMKYAESIKENYYNMQMNYFESYKKNQENTRRIKHDMKNHLYVLRTMTQTEDAVNYIDDILKNIQEGQVQYFTGNTTLDAILNAKSESIKEKKINFKLDGSFQEKLNIEPFGICTIFGNAMDNAIEAVSKMKEEDRYIKFIIRKIQGFWSIKISNSCVDKVAIDKGIILSSKKNLNEHGYGINNMKREIEKNKGNLNIDISQNEFQLKIILPE